jgi:hypothetical protein
MKIVKRENGCVICTSSMWLIPTISYMFGKVGGMTYHREWIWWVGIPTLILGWILLNWKIENGRK